MKALLACVGALVATMASAETWYWVGHTIGTNNDKYNFYEPLNWTNATGQTGFPGYGDTVIGTRLKSADSSYAYGVCGANGSHSATICNEHALESVLYPADVGVGTINFNQGRLVLKAGGQGVQFLHKNHQKSNYTSMGFVGIGEVPVNVAVSNVVWASQQELRAVTTTTDPVCDVTLVKKGPGTFVATAESGNRVYDIPRLHIQEGVVNLTSTAAPAGKGMTIAFDGNCGWQRLEYCYKGNGGTADYSSDLELKDGGLAETNGVDNTDHGISCYADKQLILSGTPSSNPMVFTGTFYDKAGLKWNPSADDKVFVCSKAVSATTGRMTVQKGEMQLSNGASFTSLASLTVAAGAKFTVDAGSGANFRAESLELGDATATLTLGAGVNLVFHGGSLAGKPLAATTYSADASGDTKRAAWISGEGTVTFETGTSAAAAWDGGAGADTSLLTDANWADDEAPDFTDGKLFATFAEAGTTATIPSATTAKFNGLYLQNGFSFAAGSGAKAEIGNGGLTAPDCADGATATYTMGWPLELTEAQNWNFGAGNAFALAAPVSGSGSAKITSAATVTLSTPCPDYAGAFDLAAGTFNVSGVNPLGVGTTPARYSVDKATLAFADDTTIDRPVEFYWTAGDETAAGVTVPAGKTVTFNGLVNYPYNGKQMIFTAPEGAAFYFNEGIGCSGGFTKLRLNGSGTYDFGGRCAGVGAFHVMAGQNPTIVFHAPSNHIMGINAEWFNGGRLVTLTDFALTDLVKVEGRVQKLYFASPTVVDMSGHDQAIDGLVGSGEVTSERAATFHLRYATFIDVLTSAQTVRFTGRASLSYEGSQTYTLGSVCTATGSVSVAKGELVLTENASWPNATNVSVSNGTLTLKHAGAFGETTAFALSDGALNLDFDGTMEVAELRIDGRRRGGTWGAVGSGAQHETALITGTGFLHSDERGVMLLIR